MKKAIKTTLIVLSVIIALFIVMAIIGNLLPNTPADHVQGTTKKQPCKLRYKPGNINDSLNNYADTAKVHRVISYFESIKDSVKDSRRAIIDTILANKQHYIASAAIKMKNKAIAARNRAFKKQFSKWDGSHINLKQLLKSNLHNPKSFEHVKTTWQFYDESHIIIKMQYRAENAFGALRLAQVTAIADVNGNIVKIVSQN